MKVRCVVMPERVVYLGRNRIRHIMPECHVQQYEAVRDSTGNLRPVMDEQKEQDFIRDNWKSSYDNPDYGRFRIDFARRVLKDFSYQQAADYLRANQAAWPDYDFTSEIRYFEARERGERVCEVCQEILKPAPACDCGCQEPPKRVPGFSTMGAALKTPPRAPTSESGRSDPPTPPAPASPDGEAPDPWSGLESPDGTPGESERPASPGPA